MPALSIEGDWRLRRAVNPNQADLPTEHISHRILRLEIEVEVGMKELLAMHTFPATVVENLGEEMETNIRDK